MKITAVVKVNLNTDELKGKVEEAARKAMSHIVSDVVKDAVIGSPVQTGNNRRSIAGEVSGMGVVADGGGASPEKIVDDVRLEGAVYSTSGYGGYLETGTVRMGAQPYIKPAVDKHFTEANFAQKVRDNLK